MDAVIFAGWICFTLTKRMPRRIHHVIEGHGADVCADAVSHADIPIDRCKRSVNTQHLRRLDGTPHFMAVVFTDYLVFTLKIRIYRQKQFTTNNCVFG